MKKVKKEPVLFGILIILLTLSLIFGFISVNAANGDLEIGLEVTEVMVYDYPEGVYELEGVFSNQFTSDTFTISFKDVYAEAGDKLSCKIIKSDNTELILESAPFSTKITDGTVDLSYQLQVPNNPYISGGDPGVTDPSGHASEVWYISECALKDSDDNILKINDLEYPIYAKTTYWHAYASGGKKIPFDTSNAHLARVSDTRAYFGHDDTTENDFSFALKKVAAGNFEGICDDNIDNDFIGEPSDGIDCDDSDCQTVFFPSCGHAIQREYDAGGNIVGFATKGITGMYTFPNECTWENGNICYKDDIGLGTEMYYTMSASPSGRIKVMFVKNNIDNIAYLILKDGGGVFGILDGTTSSYGYAPETRLPYERFQANEFKTTSRQNIESTEVFTGNLDMVMSIDDLSSASGVQNILLNGYIGDPLPVDTVLEVDISLNKPTNDDESDVNLAGVPCGDRVDNDLDYYLDCRDADCDEETGFNGKTCEYPNERTCSDNEDNDEEGGADCADHADCDGKVGNLDGDLCQSNEVGFCSDLFDNDADNYADCLDNPDCWKNGIDCPATELICNDDIDDDNDRDYDQGYDTNPLTGKDCTDYDCAGAPNCPTSEYDGTWQTCFDTIDIDLDYLVDCTDEDCDTIANPGGDTCFSIESKDNCDDGLDKDYGCCDDDFDNDNDGDEDCADAGCWQAFGSCGPCPDIENYKYDSCADNNDNDNADGVDCADNVDCNGEIGNINGAQICANAENTATLCSDEFDNDASGQADCADPNCAGIGVCEPENTAGACDDNEDNDGDNKIDCKDEDCQGVGSCAGGWSTGCLTTPSYATLSGQAGMQVGYYERVRRGSDVWRIEFSDEDPTILGGKIEIYIGEGGGSGNAIPFDDAPVKSGDSADAFDMTKTDQGDGEYTLFLKSNDNLNALSYLDLAIEIPTSLVGLEEHNILVVLGETAGGKAAMPTITVESVESDLPLVTDIEIEPLEADNSIEVEYNTLLSFRGAVSDASDICSCHVEIEKQGANIYTEDTNGNCISTVQFTKDTEVANDYTVFISATDKYGTQGSDATKSFSVEVTPKDTTNNYNLNKVFYKPLDTMDVGIFEFTTGEEDSFSPLPPNCEIVIEDISGVQQALIQLDGGGIGVIDNKITCSGSITLPSLDDGMYFIKARVTDSDADTIVSGPKIFYVCENTGSSGTGWTCARADFDQNNLIDTCENKALITGIIINEAISPIAGGTMSVDFDFVATASVSNTLNHGSARARFVYVNDETLIKDWVGCGQTGGDDFSAVYSCTIGMEYYDKKGNWRVEVEVSDSKPSLGEGYEIFAYGETGAIGYPASLGFGDIDSGDKDVFPSSDLMITNNGNLKVEGIGVTGTNLVGVSDNNYEVDANNFFINDIDPGASCTGTQLQEKAEKQRLNLDIPVHQGAGANLGEQLFVCIDTVPSLPAQQYLTELNDGWMIRGLAFVYE